jgi:hypothetical protein
VKPDGIELALEMLEEHVGAKVLRVFVEDVTDWDYEDE